MAHPRQIDAPLVDAYLARRALDYLVGFTLSPVLWRKLPGARSAGRVQSVALRLVCDREAEIERFVRQEYWQIAAHLDTPRNDDVRGAPHRLRGQAAAEARHRDRGRRPTTSRPCSKARRSASLRSRPSRRRRNPGPPFTTSTLQQAASSQSRLLRGRAPCRSRSGSTKASTSAARPTGLITYMRTDGVQMAPEAIDAARARDRADASASSYLPDKPRYYSTKAKNAQEAHEAIRPTDFSRTPAEVRQYLDADQARLYETDLEARHRQPDAGRRDRAHHRRDRRRQRRPHGRRCAPSARSSASTASSPPIPTRRKTTQEDEENRRLPRDPSRARRCAKRADRADPALDRAAAALLRSDADQEDGGARHRPAFHLHRDPEDARGPRLRHHRQAQAGSGGQGPPALGVPGELLRALRRIRLHRLARGEARRDLRRQARLEGRAARLLARFLRRRRRHQGAARHRRAGRAQRGAGAAGLPAARGRLQPAHLPEMRHRQPVAEARQVRRLRRLLELSRLQLHAPARRRRQRQWRGRRRRGRRPRCSARTPTPARRSR